MDRNSVWGMLIIIAIIVGYSLYMRPSAEEIEAAKKRRDSLALVYQQEQEATQHKTIQADTAVISQNKSAVEDSNRTKQKMLELGSFAAAASGEEQLITVETNNIKARITSKGARIYSVQLKKFQKYDSSALILFDGDTNSFGLQFFANTKSISTNELFFIPQCSSQHITVENDSLSLTLRLYAGEESYLDYIYTFYPDSYKVGFQVSFTNMNKIIAANTNYMDLQWSMYAPPLEKGQKNENSYTSIYYKFFEDEVDNLNPRSGGEKSEILTTKVKWVSFSHQFFASVLIANEAFLNGKVKYIQPAQEESPYLKHFMATLAIPYANKNTFSVPMSFYFGPIHFNTLKKYQLEELVSLGGSILRVINRYLIIPIFNFLEQYIGNYGIIILLLTLIIKIMLLPLTFGSYMSMAKMRVLKPQIDEINNKIPKEKAMERQQATMALYKKAGVSPLGGCIPMLLQLPILFAMYRFFPTSFELRQESFLWAKDLSTYDSILDLPFNIPLYGSHISLFTLLMAITTIISMKTNNQMSGSSSQMPGMQTMMYMMPVMLLVVLNNFSSGLTYYLFLSNIITFGQNALFKLFVDEEKLFQKLEANKKRPIKKSSFQARLEAMARERGYATYKKKR